MNVQVVSMPKKTTPPAGGEDESIGVKLSPRSLSALDAWIAAQPEPRPTRPDAVRRLLERALEPFGDAGTIPSEELNASNDE